MNITLLIILCALVTFIPRVIPAIFMERLNFSPKFEKFLNLIPYTALAALICPGVLTVDPNLWYIGLIGAVIAGGWSGNCRWTRMEKGTSWSYCYFNCDCFSCSLLNCTVFPSFNLTFLFLIFNYYHIAPYIHSFHTFSSQFLL